MSDDRSRFISAGQCASAEPEAKPAQLLRHLGISGTGADDGRWLILAAHPDDETIGATWLLHHAADVRVVHVTDGAPRNSKLWSFHASGARWLYAEQRAHEAREALALAGISESRIRSLGMVDQEASFALEEVTLRLERLLRTFEPTFLVVQPYEGGHPDHDAAAFAAHACIRRCEQAGIPVPTLIEMTAYHRHSGALQTGSFLPAPRTMVRCILRPDERELKRRMMQCFVSQREVLSAFSESSECFRCAPQYCFSRPPHPGLLNYEHWGWSLTGARWQRLAGEALRKLGLPRDQPRSRDIEEEAELGGPASC